MPVKDTAIFRKKHSISKLLGNRYKFSGFVTVTLGLPEIVFTFKVMVTQNLTGVNYMYLINNIIKNCMCKHQLQSTFHYLIYI